MRLRTMALALTALLGACGGGEPAGPPPPPVSPNGEPLVSAGVGASCEVALGQWFDATDLNHDGFLDMAEFTADSTRWFAVMDANRDGAVTPDELTALRLKLVPPTIRPPRGSDEARDGRERRGWFASKEPRPPRERPDPVMAADLNLDNRVTAEEFQAQTARNFAGLDRNRDGRLAKDEVLVACQRQRAG
jgi:Ca2+-binding EF-hand superfamily protein